MENILKLFSGVAWTIVYIECIRVSFKEKTYAMPFGALALNFAWEVLHGIIATAQLGFQLQPIVNIVWAVFDAVILVAYFKFGQKYMPKNVTKPMFTLWSGTILFTCFAVQFMFIAEFTLVIGAAYSAFLQNLLMSIMFIAMFYQREPYEGQSLVIARVKFVGTVAPTLLFGVVGMDSAFPEGNSFVLVLGSLIGILDLYYIGLLVKHKKREVIQ